MSKVDILGVRIDVISMEQAIQTTLSWLKMGKKRYIVTPNPEFVMLAQSDEEFKKILNQADLAIPDGAGLKLSGKIKEIVSGVDFMDKLCEACAKEGFTVAFLGGRNGVAKKTAECLQKKYPELIVEFAEDGPELQLSAFQHVSVSVPIKSGSERQNRYTETLAPTDILFVAFGMVKQEKWIYQNLSKLNATVAVGVGGAFDYLSGKVPRAPLFIRKTGFEWLFRLAVQPWRIKRQLKLIRFLYLILTS